MTSLDHLLDIDSTPEDALRSILSEAGQIALASDRYREDCRDRLMINLFYEPSTRTRVSFEIAALRLGMQVVNVAAAGSSVVKGESLMDTFHTLQAMSPDVVVLRHPDNGAPLSLAEQAEPGVHLVNAGDGSRSHPTQGLLDALTLQLHFPDLSAITVLVAGDLNHSRVTASTVALLKKLGVGELRLASPPGLEAPADVAAGTVAFDSLDAALPGADAIMMLRIQHERMGGAAAPESAAYHREWGLTPQRLAVAGPDCIVMHPGPMNRVVEIAPEVADGPQSVIREQVRNGVFVRMAVLKALLS